MLSPPSSSQLLYSVRPPFMLNATLPLMPTVPSSWPVWLLTPGNQGYQLREVPTIQLKLGDFLAGDGAGQFGRLSFDLRHVGALHDNFRLAAPTCRVDVHASFLRDIQYHALGLILLETRARSR